MKVRAPIFYFHRVASDNLEAAVPAEVFADHLAHWRELGVQSVSLEQIARHLNGGGLLLPPRAINISFDDCYADLLDRALPLLDEYGFRASFFAVAGHLGGRSYWSQGAARELRLMNADHLRQLAAQGHEIGSHSFHHRSLTWLPLDELWAELADSRQVLEQVLGRPVVALAYPFGDVAPWVAEAAEAAGYLTARGLRRGNLHCRHSLFDLSVINSMRLRDRVSQGKMAHYLGRWYEWGARKEALGRRWQRRRKM
ncbi:MAG: polysaccharide deacetylase family protein [Desulfarculus sp.]|nr:polysaccharide deacetylase family protein [Desulfarculus sp.]